MMHTRLSSHLRAPNSLLWPAPTPNLLQVPKVQGSVGEPVIKCEFEKVISMEYMVYFNFFVWVLPPLLLMVLIYLRVKIPLRYKTVVTQRRAAVAIAGCWILSLVVGLTPMFGWNNLSEVEQAWIANGSVGVEGET